MPLYNPAGTLADASVTLPKLATQAANTAVANATGSTASPTAVAMTSAATASTIAIRDSSANLTASNFINEFASTATAAGTTTLTISSEFIQVFTGTNTQIVTLPVVSTLTTGHAFRIINQSTGRVTINSSGGNAVLVLPGGGSEGILTSNATTGTGASVWYQTYIPPNIATQTAYLHLPAGTTAASTAPLKLTTGSLNTTAELGAIEYDGNRLYATIGSTALRHQLNTHHSEDMTVTTVTATAVETTIFTTTVYSKTIEANRTIKGNILFHLLNDTGSAKNFTIRLKWGTVGSPTTRLTFAHNVASNANTRYGIYEFWIAPSGSATSQEIFARSAYSAGTATPTSGSAFDGTGGSDILFGHAHAVSYNQSTSDATLTVTVQMESSVANQTATMEAAWLEIV